MSSDNEGTTKAITLERVIEGCGSFGRYQRLHLAFLLLFPIASGIFNYYYVFGVAETPHTCLPPKELPLGVTLITLDRQCLLIGIVGDETGNLRHLIHSCTEWTYDRRVFGKTFVEEANLVCSNSVFRSLLSTALQLGAMSMFFTGQITDRIGRRRSMHLLIALLLLTCMTTQTLLQFVPMSIDLK